MMKQCYLLFTIVLFILSFANAQDENPLYTRAGFKIGPNYSAVTGDLDATKGRVRMHLGAVIEFPVSERFYIQAEVLYSAQGYTIEEDGFENELSLNYLSLPILAKYYFTPKLSFETGPRFATLASVTESREDSTDEFFNTYESSDVGWNFGIGYKAESGMFLQLHYILGLRQIIDTNILDVSAKNSLVQLSIGYLFKTKNNRRQESAE